LLVYIVCLSVSSAFAQWRIQDIALVPGWNAVQLEITPEPSECEKIFAGLQIESVWKWNKRFTTTEFSVDPGTLLPDDPIEIVVRDSRGEQSIMQTNVPPVGAAGDVILVNVTASTDADHDGMADDWEQELVDMSTNYNFIADIKPNDDFDGDGASNLREFNSGNFAFLNYDYMFVEKITRVGSRFKFELLSVPGKAYYLTSSTNIIENSWIDAPFATTETGAAKPQLLEGDGDWLSFYVEYPDTRRYFRLNVK